MMAMLAGQARSLLFGFLALVVVVLAIFHPETAMAIVVTAATGIWNLAVQAADGISAAVSYGQVGQ